MKLLLLIVALEALLFVPLDAASVRGKDSHRSLQSMNVLTGLDLINAQTEIKHSTLVNNQIVVVSSIPGMVSPNFNINATYNLPGLPGTAPIQSVVFRLNGVVVQTENAAPWAFCGNVGLNYNTCGTLGYGTHVVTATPFSAAWGSGTPGTPLSLSFTIVPNPTASPVAPVTMAPVTQAPVALTVTKAPVPAPTKAPTNAPVKDPTKAPTTAPVPAPTKNPTKEPTQAPIPLTPAPTKAPTKDLTKAPISAPTKNPTGAPVKSPTLAPVSAPVPVADSPTLGLTLVYTGSPSPHQSVMNLVLNAVNVVDLKTLNVPTASFNINATRASTNVQSVAFNNGQNENGLPWAYCGNQGTNYFTCGNLIVGATVTIVVTPFTGSWQSGTALAPVSTTVQIIDSRLPATASPTLPPALAPVPAPKSPTQAPASAPTLAPKSPTLAPVPAPTLAPVPAPTLAPKSPTLAPVKSPTLSPVSAPALHPSGMEVLQLMYTGSPSPHQSVLNLTFDAINVVDLKTLDVPTAAFSINAVRQSTAVQSVMFNNGQNENGLPWAYCGNQGRNFYTCGNLIVGATVTIVVTPFAQTWWQGPALPTATTTVQIIDSRTLAPVSVPIVTPVPVSTAPVPAPMSVPTATSAPVPAPMGVPPATSAPVPAPRGVQPVTLAPVVVAPAAPPDSFIWRINVGGGTFIDDTRNIWISDEGLYTGGTVYTTTSPIDDTVDDDLFRTSRYGPNLVYSIAVPNGIYEVQLRFAETNYTNVGDRVFGVLLEATSISEIDILQVAGGVSNRAVEMNTAAVVTDGSMTIRFIAKVNDPMIAAIYFARLGDTPPVPLPTNAPIMPTPSPVTSAPTLPPATSAPVSTPVLKPPTLLPSKAPTTPPTKVPTAVPTRTPTLAPVAPPMEATLINCGSSVNFTDTSGRLWLSDRYFNGGTPSSTNIDIAATNDDFLYQTNRFGQFSYTIPNLQDGEYDVILHFSEIYHNADNERVFSVAFLDGNGDEDIIGLDVFVAAGGSFRAMKRTAEGIPVTNGNLTIQTDAIIDLALISAIEVIKVADHFAHAVAGGPYVAVDLNGDGFENVPLNAVESHTHFAGGTLISYTWRQGENILGVGPDPVLYLPVGDTEIELTVIDSGGSISSDSTVVRVEQTGFPSLSSLSPSSGPIQGGTIVTLTGQDIGTATAIRVGPNLVTSFNVVNSGTITFVTPGLSIGIDVQVSVVTPRGESNHVKFTYNGNIPISFDDDFLVNIDDPTAVVFGPDGNLYVGSQKGTLSRVTLDPVYETVVSVLTVNVSVGRCILGIAFDPLETPEMGHNISVYVSTSQIYHGESSSKSTSGRSINGKVQKVTGAGLNVISDVITGLPVSKIDHSVNGLYFGNKGELYVGVGSNTNAGHPASIMGNAIETYFSAAVLVANMGHANFNGTITYSAPHNGNPISGFGPSGVEVFAAGLRNPYGVVVHSNGRVYATDNGPNEAYGRMSTGCFDLNRTVGITEEDKLALLEKGGFYGHANRKRGESDPRQCVWRSSLANSTFDYTAPLMSVESSMNGIVEFESDHFGGQLRGNLIISKYKEQMFRVILSPDGRSINPLTNPAVELDGYHTLAVTQAPNGNLVDARHTQDRVHVYIPEEPTTSVLEIKAVFPRRGRLAGGSKFMVFGVNFGGTGTLTVTVGGNTCTSPVIVSTKKIECILPSGSEGSKDVVVTLGTKADTFFNGYRYITGKP